MDKTDFTGWNSDLLIQLKSKKKGTLFKFESHSHNYAASLTFS